MFAPRKQKYRRAHAGVNEGLAPPQVTTTMQEGWVVVEGRTKDIPDQQKQKEKEMERDCLLLIAVVVLIAFPFMLYTSESFYHNQMVAFQEVEDKIVQLADVDSTTAKRAVDLELVHFTSDYNSTVSDWYFGLHFDHALRLKRYTQYCQWQEHSNDVCEKCHRRNDKGEDEEYDCNCRRTYWYDKGWRSGIIPSSGFDQPAKHHNPMRDPAPSATYYSDDMVSGAIEVAPAILAKLRARDDPVIWSFPSQKFNPSFGGRLFGEEPSERFEDRRSLRSFVNSSAYARDHFVYTNTPEGWFFSAYEEDTWSRMFRGVGQFMEGSLFNWQFGDLYDMVNGCTAGDIRSRYYIADPEIISVVGAPVGSRDASTIEIVQYTSTSNNFPIGMLHAGAHSPESMLAKEEDIAHRGCYKMRALNLLTGLALVHLGSASGMITMNEETIIIGGGGIALGCWLTIMSLVWAFAYGLSDWGGWDTDLWTVIFLIVGVLFLRYGMIAAGPKKKRA